MKGEGNNFRNDIERQAAIWVDRLHFGEISKEEREALQRWLEENPTHQECFAAYQKISYHLDPLLTAMVREGAVPAPAAREPSGVLPRRAWIPLATAAAALLALLLWTPFRYGPQHDIRTAGQERQERLADGSVVDLKGTPVLAVEMTQTERRVHLAQGKAVFSVVEDLSRAFIVETPAGSVRVTGTVFSINAGSGDRLEVAVLEGSVDVFPAPARPGAQPAAGSPVEFPEPAAPAAPLSLTAGQQVSLNAGLVELQELPIGLLEDLVAWRHGGVVLDGVFLRDAFERFGSLHRKVIVIAPDIEHLRLGGRFDLGDYEGFLGAVESTFPVRVVRNEREILVVGRNR